MRWLALVLLTGCAPRVLGLPGRDAMVAYVANAKGAQHLCVVPYDHYAWVYWQEGRRLILWEGSPHADALVRSRRVLDLDKDVVATEADVAGSTYLVTKAWVRDTLRDCREYGMRYTITGQ